MGKDDYASTGGALKLKGGGITKKKKKSKKPKTDVAKSATPTSPTRASSANPTKQPSVELVPAVDDDFEVPKTEAEKRFEERKRRMMDKKLEKEGGVKSHKERVEEYNRYLASLSEHHDMPRIGPG